MLPIIMHVAFLFLEINTNHGIGDIYYMSNATDINYFTTLLQTTDVPLEFTK